MGIAQRNVDVRMNDFGKFIYIYHRDRLNPEKLVHFINHIKNSGAQMQAKFNIFLLTEFH